MGFDFLSPKDALLLVQDELPKIQGRGRTATPYTMPDGVREIAESVRELGGTHAAPVAVGIPKADGRVPSTVLNELRKLNQASKGNGYHFVIRSDEGSTSATLYATAGEMPERKRSTDNTEAE